MGRLRITAAERVAKPYGRGLRREERNLSDVSSKGETKKGAGPTGNAVGPKILCEARFEVSLKSTEADSKSAASVRENR